MLKNEMRRFYRAMCGDKLFREMERYFCRSISFNASYLWNDFLLIGKGMCKRGSKNIKCDISLNSMTF
jgi:hypothetical protein